VPGRGVKSRSIWIMLTAGLLLKRIAMAAGRVVFNHQEALDHCPYTRARLREALKGRGLLDKCAIPDDGGILDFG